MTAHDRENPFWQYSLKVYALPGVADVCLQLQDQYGCNVNLLLLAAWAATQGIQLSRSDFVQLQESIGAFDRQTIQPLRTLRRQVSLQSSLPQDWQIELRRSLLAAELLAEQMEQALLYEVLQPMRQPREVSTSAQANLSTYLVALNQSSNPELAGLIKQLAQQLELSFN